MKTITIDQKTTEDVKEVLHLLVGNILVQAASGVESDSFIYDQVAFAADDILNTVCGTLNSGNTQLTEYNEPQ